MVTAFQQALEALDYPATSGYPFLVLLVNEALNDAQEHTVIAEANTFKAMKQAIDELREEFGLVGYEISNWG